MPTYTINFSEPTGIEVVYPTAHHDPTKLNTLVYHTYHMRNRLDIEAVRWYKVPYYFEDATYAPTTVLNYRKEINATRQLRFLDFKHLIDIDGVEPKNTLKIWPTTTKPNQTLSEIPGTITIQQTTISDQPKTPLYLAGPIDRGLRAINGDAWVPYTHWPTDHLEDWNKLYGHPLTQPEYRRLWKAYQIYPTLLIDGVPTNVTTVPFRITLPPGKHVLDADWLKDPVFFYSFGHPTKADADALINQLRTENALLLQQLDEQNPAADQRRIEELRAENATLLKRLNEQPVPYTPAVLPIRPTTSNPIAPSSFRAFGVSYHTNKRYVPNLIQYI